MPVKGAQGGLAYRWDDGGKADHYAHAEVYCSLAGQAGRVRPGFYVSGMSDAEIAEFAAGPRRSSLQGGGDA